LLVDGGGGNGLLYQLLQSGNDWRDIHDIFITHKHIDHLLGIIWLLRLFLQGMSRREYDGTVNIFAHAEVIEILRKLAVLLFEPRETRFIDDRLLLITVHDREEKTIIGETFLFFDIHSSKAKQYGFRVTLNNGKTLCCCGDEPCSEEFFSLVKNCDVLLHEAFCLFCEKDRFEPYKKSHSTVKDACELAEKLNVQRLVLYHTEDSDIANRKKRYIEEGKAYFHGKLLIPDDLDTIDIE